MKELLVIEYLKLKNHTGFRAFMLLYFVLLPLVYWAISLMEIPFFATGSTLFRFPGVWRYLPYVASWFTVFPGILMVSLVCSEISFKTQKQNVIDGLSRKEVILAKFYVLLVLTVVQTLYLFLLGAIFGIFSSGLGNIFGEIEGVLFFFIQTGAVLVMGMLIAVIIRNSALSILAFLMVFLFAGVLLSQTIPEDLAQWMPFNMISDAVSNPWLADFERLEQMTNPSGASAIGSNLWIISGGVLLYSVLFLMLSYVVIKKRDL